MKVRGKHGEAPTEEIQRLRVKLKSRRYLIKSRRCLIKSRRYLLKSRRYLLKSRRYLIVFRRDLLLPRWEAWATDLNRDECRSVFNRTARFFVKKYRMKDTILAKYGNRIEK